MATRLAVGWRRLLERMNASADDYPANQRALPPAVVASAAFKFSPGQERWPGGTPGGLGGQWKDDGVPDVDVPSAPTGKKVLPAIIYKKHKDGAVVAQRGSRRFRWDAGSKKFAAEEREGDAWVEKAQLTKTAAYAEMKDGDWHEPGKSAPIKIDKPAKAVLPSPTPEPEPEIVTEPEPTSSQTPEPEAPVVEPTAETVTSVADQAEIAQISAELDEIYEANRHRGRTYAELFEKQYQKASGILNKYDQSVMDAAYQKLNDVYEEARPRVRQLTDLLAARSDETAPNASRWSGTVKAQVSLRPKTNRDAMDKIAYRYVTKDLVTVTNNASLRTDEPSDAALKWAKSISRMVNSGEIAEDTRVYRGAAFPTDLAATLTPGVIMHDRGFMSAGFDNATARHYAGERVYTRPGYVPTIFEIRVPKGTRAYEVENDELVFDRGRNLRIEEVLADDGYLRVIASMVEEAA